MTDNDSKIAAIMNDIRAAMLSGVSIDRTIDAQEVLDATAGVLVDHLDGDESVSDRQAVLNELEVDLSDDDPDDPVLSDQTKPALVDSTQPRQYERIVQTSHAYGLGPSGTGYGIDPHLCPRCGKVLVRARGGRKCINAGCPYGRAGKGSDR